MATALTGTLLESTEEGKTFKEWMEKEAYKQKVRPV